MAKVVDRVYIHSYSAYCFGLTEIFVESGCDKYMV